MTALRRVVIVGDGLAAVAAAETLRRDGFAGAITMLGGGTAVPYDRPPLSKDVLTGKRSITDVALRRPDQLAALELDRRPGVAAVGLDVDRRVVRTGDGEIAFDALLIACGARARALPHLDELEGVTTLRTLADAERVTTAFARRPAVVVIGAGFIGSEVASSARAVGLDVTVVEAAAAPLQRVLGPTIGAACAALHADHGTNVRCGATVAELRGGRRVEQVVLDDGSSLAADLVVVGVGVQPNVEWLAGSGLDTSNGIVCDAALCAGPQLVFAAGDVARWPNPLFGGRTMRCEQWMNAVEQGRHVARQILAVAAGGHPAEFAGSGYFWSDQYDVNLQSVGLVDGDDVYVASGSIDDRSFLALYRSPGDRLIGAVAMNSSKQLMRAKRLVERSCPWEDTLGELTAAVGA